MLTIFSCPKPFTDPHINIIQRNAIKSWTLLQPRPEIILIGDEEGVAEVCKEFSLKHIPEVERNEYGTPLVSSIFEIGQSAASNDILCYINTDIILLKDFMVTIEGVWNLMKDRSFLLYGGRWNIKNINIDFSQNDWEHDVREFIKRFGWFDGEIAMDYFIFPKNIDWDLPPFLLGRGCWDSWFPYKARKMKIPVIDISDRVTAIHQDHHYSHFKLQKEDLSGRNIEVQYNFKLLGFGKRYIITDSTHRFTSNGIEERVGRIRFFNRLKEIELWSVYYLRDRFYPYSYPIYIILRGIKYSIRAISKLLNLNKKIL